MKNSLILFAIILTTGVFFTSCVDENQEAQELQETIFSENTEIQNQNTTQEAERVDRIPVTAAEVDPSLVTKIQTYNCLKGKKSLLVFNPFEHNMFMYDGDQFAVKWFRNGQPFKKGKAMIDCVGSGLYEVEVQDLKTNETSTAKIYLDIEVDIKEKLHVDEGPATFQENEILKKDKIIKKNNHALETNLEKPQNKASLNHNPTADQ